MSENVAVLITGRGNNTLNNKNILPVNGKPLLSYGALAAKGVKGVDRFYISSDDDNILDVGKELGYTKIKRPGELGLPTTPHGDAVEHAVKVMKVRDNFECDTLIIMMANCATITTSQIEDCLKLLREDETLSTVAPVVQNNDHHPFRAKRIREDGLIDTFVPLSGHNIASNRQQLEPNYFVCHSFYVLRVKNCFIEDGQPPLNFMGKVVKPYIVDYSLDVHSMEDIWLTEKWLEDNGDK